MSEPGQNAVGMVEILKGRFQAGRGADGCEEENRRVIGGLGKMGKKI